MEETLAVPADPRRLPEARAFVEAAAAANGFDDETRYQIIMAVNEAISNAIEHGAPCEGGSLHLTVTAGDGELALSVRDCGEFPLSGTVTPDPIAERGRGFAFMNLLMDDVRLDTGPRGTTVRLAKRIGDAPESERARDAGTTEANRLVVERVMEAFAHRDPARIFADVDLGVMFEPLSTPVRGRTPYLGRAGLRRYFDDLRETWDEFALDVGEMRSGGDYVVVLGSIRARHGDTPAAGDVGIVWRLRDRLIVWGKAYASHDEAVEAAGLAAGSADA